mmetsp:Transcript_54988/g.112330  ORF Transcript_54988/g.112330 Transcript_54988/m.112330 type:complete len:500 (-) Transcript_54988:130-1629(-)
MSLKICLLAAVLLCLTPVATPCGNAADCGSTSEKPFPLGPHDLPGYTGWTRPSKSVAPWIQVTSFGGASSGSVPVIHAGSVMRVQLVCTNTTACPSTGGTLFYVRLYGPSLQAPDAIVDHHDGTYTIVATMHDVGRWFMEIVVEFSATPPGSLRFPNQQWDKVVYEGYPVLSGSPFQFLVVEGAGSDSEPGAPCKPKQLSNLTGRWKLDGRAQPSQGAKRPMLGLSFKFEPYKCALPGMAALTGPLKSCFALWFGHKEIVLIGDSTMILQHKELLRWKKEYKGIRQWNIHFITAHGGLRATMKDVTEKVQSIAANTSSPLVIMFNSGLHDINKYCSMSRGLGTFRADNVTDCVDDYARHLARLQGMLQNLSPKPLLIFRTTTAGWSKWGNWGFAWPHQESQIFIHSHAMVARMNQVASAILDPAIPVIDGYHLSLPRPDHTEISTEIGKRMVHHDYEISQALNLLFINLVLATNKQAYFRCTTGRGEHLHQRYDPTKTL